MNDTHRPGLFATLRLGKKYMKSWPQEKSLSAIFPENRVCRATQFGIRFMPPIAVFILCWQLAFHAQIGPAIATAVFACSLPVQGLWWLGNRRLMQERGLWNDTAEAAAERHESQGRSVTLLADATAVRALYAVSDTLRPQAKDAVADLRALGIVPVMLTGDHGAAAQAAAREAGIDEVQASLLPEQKLAAIAALQQKHGMTAMAGDGINDAPALAKADIGFAMGGAGTDVAMETADVVIMNDDLRRVAETVRLSRRTHAVLMQNIALALGIKLVFFGLALAGQATMWMAVFADMGASLLVVGNGLRMLRAERPAATLSKQEHAAQAA